MVLLLPWFHSRWCKQQSTEYCGVDRVDRVLLVHALSTLPRSPPSFVPSLLTFTAVLPNNLCTLTSSSCVF